MKTLALPKGSRAEDRPGLWPGVALAGAVVAAFALYAPVIPGLVEDWWSHAEYSHGFAVPVVAAYLAWRRRHEAAAAPMDGSWAGLLLFLAGVGLYAVGAWAFEPFVMRVSLPIVLAGAVWFVGGSGFMKPLAFPLAYLVFMIPLPYPIFKTLALGLRYLDAEIAAAVLTRLQVPVLQDGYFLHLPRITLEVADGCSGLFSIVSLLAVGALYAHLTLNGFWRRLVILLAIIPVAVGVNILRIVIIAWVSHVSGDWIFMVTFKTFTGIFNFLLSGLVIVALGQWLSGLGRKRRPA
ncbi:MAG: exosortase/archaeosortase family protein [Nitrospiria bacterium]